MTNIGLNLRRMRKSRGLTQADLSAVLGVSRSTVALLEHGKRKMRAQEVEVLASTFGCSTASLFAEHPPEPQAGDEDELLAEVSEALSGCDPQTYRPDELERILKIATTLTKLEAKLGLDCGSLGPHSYDLAPPETAWEATQQGILAAAEERRRLGLGDAPIRDVDETLASNRIRMTKSELPTEVSGIFLNSPRTGFLLIVNSSIPVERRRFQLAHGYAHVLFDRNHRCLTCRKESRHDFSELRASAFAIRFLLPEPGVRRHLASLGKETLGRSARGELEVYSEPFETTREERRIRVLGRGRRGAEPISYCDVVQTAWFYGVTPSMAAGVLHNLRYVTKEELQRLDEIDEATPVMPLKDALGFPEHYVETGRDAFRSRLLALSVESLNQGLITHDDFLESTDLVEIGEDQRSALLSQVSTDKPPTKEESKDGDV